MDVVPAEHTLDCLTKADFCPPAEQRVGTGGIKHDGGNVVGANRDHGDRGGRIDAEMLCNRVKDLLDRMTGTGRNVKMPVGASSRRTKSIRSVKSDMSRKSRTALVQKQFCPAFSRW